MLFHNYLVNKLREEKAFGIIDALMAIVIMSIALFALIGLFSISVKAVASSKASTTATQLANKKIEEIRAKPFDDIIPGPATEETQAILGTTYTIKTTIEWVDDPIDNENQDPKGRDLRGGRTDYKRVEVTVKWTSNGKEQKFTTVTFVRNTPPPPSAPPEINFVYSSGNSPPNGIVFCVEPTRTNIEGVVEPNPYYEKAKELLWVDWYGLYNTQQKVLFKLFAKDTNNDLVYVGVQGSSGLHWEFSPRPNFTTPSWCGLYPHFVKEGSFKIRAIAKDEQGNISQPAVTEWIIDKRPPEWDGSANLTGRGQGENSIRLTWKGAKDSDHDYATHYQIYRKLPETNWQKIQDDCEAQDFIYDDKGLEEFTTYYYKIVPISAGGRLGKASEVEEATTWFHADGTAGKKVVNLTWHLPTGSNKGKVNIFAIHRDGKLIGWVGPTTNSFTDDGSGKGLQVNRAYSYEILAYDDSDNIITNSITVSVRTGS
ncbi:MAG: hypothetical protein IBX64_06555 [Actinobacteria bacterium]|nr:hypothetical protein [Actinomycetota bacterium]